MRQGCPLLQPQVSTDEQFSSRDRRRVLHIGQALHHHCGHPLEKHKGKICFVLVGILPDDSVQMAVSAAMLAYTQDRSWLIPEAMQAHCTAAIELKLIYSTMAVCRVNKTG